MPTNIEIKAKISSLEDFRRKIEKLNVKETGEIFQEDTFFKISNGRLKLRTFGEEIGELIYYVRENLPGPKRSDYHIFKTTEPNALRQILENSLGIRGVVKKRRLLYLVGNTRIHLDEVERLGSFLELEIILSQGEDEKCCRAIANEIMEKLDIKEKDLVDKAYIELLERHA
jgi:predicted adenylyl cyclase CyaB